jgi:hypothetical protein
VLTKSSHELPSHGCMTKPTVQSVLHCASRKYCATQRSLGGGETEEEEGSSSNNNNSIPSLLHGSFFEKFPPSYRFCKIGEVVKSQIHVFDIWPHPCSSLQSAYHGSRRRVSIKQRKPSTRILRCDELSPVFVPSHVPM